MATAPRLNPPGLTAGADGWKAEFPFLFRNAFQTPGPDPLSVLGAGSWRAPSDSQPSAVVLRPVSWPLRPGGAQRRVTPRCRTWGAANSPTFPPPPPELAERWIICAAAL